MYVIRDEIDEEITLMLHEDDEFILLSDEVKEEVLKRLNKLLHHTIYKIDD